VLIYCARVVCVSCSLFVALVRTSRTAIELLNARNRWQCEQAQVCHVAVSDTAQSNTSTAATTAIPLTATHAAALGQEKRRQNVRKKLNPIRSVFEGKRVLLIDDSIVRGTTSKVLSRCSSAGTATGSTAHTVTVV
jgi:predicted amidophosphoribosyltransferase